jgi:hypothetical protein
MPIASLLLATKIQIAFTGLTAIVPSPGGRGVDVILVDARKERTPRTIHVPHKMPKHLPFLAIPRDAFEIRLGSGDTEVVRCTDPDWDCIKVDNEKFYVVTQPGAPPDVSGLSYVASLNKVYPHAGYPEKKYRDGKDVAALFHLTTGTFKSEPGIFCGFDRDHDGTIDYHIAEYGWAEVDVDPSLRICRTPDCAGGAKITITPKPNGHLKQLWIKNLPLIEGGAPVGRAHGGGDPRHFVLFYDLLPPGIATDGPAPICHRFARGSAAPPGPPVFGGAASVTAPPPVPVPSSVLPEGFFANYAAVDDTICPPLNVP